VGQGKVEKGRDAYVCRASMHTKLTTYLENCKYLSPRLARYRLVGEAKENCKKVKL